MNERVMALLLQGLFLLMGLIHLYWATGGRWAYWQSLPTDNEGKYLMKPKALDCVIVGVGLLLFSLYYGAKGGWLPLQLPNWMLLYIGWVIPSLFLLRAVGDFNYLGLFKKIKATPFGRADSRFFIPLCMLLALLGYWVQS